MPVTIKDVAREAGVSISTVSRVINDMPGISEATTLRVKEIMRRLEYAPNSRAAGLARKSARCIAFWPSSKSLSHTPIRTFLTSCAGFRRH